MIVSNTNQASSLQASTLYVVATPIGNLGDISARAVDVLGSADKIAAEDTRHTKQLLNKLGIDNQLFSLHEHNERERVASVLTDLEQGLSIALVSDAGTPAISDPGFILVREVRAAGYPVVPIPGASALVAALSAAGLPTNAFIFDGFLPAKQKARQDMYRLYLSQSRTVVVYESSHRILASLKDLREVLGERQITVCRELTKMYETFISGSVSEVLSAMESDSNQQRGEFVILIEGAPEQDSGDEEILSVLSPLVEELPPKQAAALTAKITGCKKKYAYELAVGMKNN